MIALKKSVATTFFKKHRYKSSYKAQFNNFEAQLIVSKTYNVKLRQLALQVKVNPRFDLWNFLFDPMD